MIRTVDLRCSELSAAVLDQYVQAGLPESEALAVERHLDVCADCRCRKELIEFWADAAGDPKK